MAAGAWITFSEGIFQTLTGGLDLDTNTFRMVLVTASWVPNKDRVGLRWSDISANEVAAAGGYTTHGKLLTCTVTRPGSPQDQIMFDCDDQSWTSSTITAKYAVIVRDGDANGALAATDIPLAYVDLNQGGASVSTTNGTFAVNIDVNGVFRATES
jgi:hypothetical protein